MICHNISQVPSPSDIFEHVHNFVYTEQISDNIKQNVVILLEVLACADSLLFEGCKQAVESLVSLS